MMAIVNGLDDAGQGGTESPSTLNSVFNPRINAHRETLVRANPGIRSYSGPKCVRKA